MLMHGINDEQRAKEVKTWNFMELPESSNELKFNDFNGFYDVS